MGDLSQGLPTHRTHTYVSSGIRTSYSCVSSLKPHMPWLARLPASSSLPELHFRHDRRVTKFVKTEKSIFRGHYRPRTASSGHDRMLP